MDHTITEHGLQADPEKVRAILEMPSPANVEELRRFMGTVNYLAKFIWKMSTITAPLCNLLKQDLLWVWSTSQQAVETLKTLITTAPVLAFYDRLKELILENGLGSVLI